MNKFRKIIYTLATCVLIGGFSSCADYLDVSSELEENLDIEQVFKNPKYLKKWYAEIYSTIPRYSQTGYGASTGFHGVWNMLAGEMTAASGVMKTQASSSYNAESAPFPRWSSCYKQIRQAMIFLQRAPETVGSSMDDSYIDNEQMKRMKADVKFLLAYNYFLLFEVYGPVPIVEEIADPENSDIDYSRASIDEVLHYIDNLLKEVIESSDLPETLLVNSDGNDYEHGAGRYNLTEILRPTKAAALALRARLWVYAASPLFNGGYPEALQVANKDGKRIFPDKDVTKWTTAKKHLEALFLFTETKGMHLYKAKPSANGKVDANLSVYELFQYYNDEILWADGNNDYNAINGSSDMETRCAPRDLFSRSGNVCLYQEAVDAFFTKNGLSIKEDQEYNETGFSDLKNICNENQHVDKHIFNMYTNREPRFYANVTYEGKSWHIQPDKTNRKDYGAYFSKGGGADNSSDMTARTGYLIYKFSNRMLLNTGTYTKKFGRPWILFRLADFYLYYAEVCNEVNPGDDNIIKYLDMVRERAGIPTYKELNATGKKKIIGDYGKQRDAIRQERRVEMMAEGNYYFDTHRWMICGYSQEKQDNEDKIQYRTGMDQSYKACDFNSNKIPTKFYDEVGNNSYYNRKIIDTYPWSKSMLLYPIPYNEMQKSKLVVQNPLWN